MYIYIPSENVRYEQIKSLSFAPECDLTAATLPVCEFTAEVVAESRPPVGASAGLYDGLGALWAMYRIEKSERVAPGVYRIVAQSPLGLMDRWTVGAVMIQNQTVSSIVNDLLTTTPDSGWIYGMTIDIDSSLRNVRLTGFCPKQTARERLQWLCLVIGAYVKQWGGENMSLAPLPSGRGTGTLIPLRDTYWRPQMVERDLVRSVTATGYSQFSTTEDEDKESATDGSGTTWYFSSSDFTYENEAYPDTPGRDVKIDKVTLLHDSRKMEVLSRLSAVCFRQYEIRADVIDNGQYWPGQKVRVYVEPETVYQGYIQSCDFTFGVQARAALVIVAEDLPVDMGTLRVNYTLNGFPLGYNEYTLPVGTAYNYTHPEITRAYAPVPGMETVRVYKPEDRDSGTSGTMRSEMDDIDVTYRLAGIPTAPAKASDDCGMYFLLQRMTERATGWSGDKMGFFLMDHGLEAIHRLAFLTQVYENGNVGMRLCYTLKGFGRDLEISHACMFVIYDRDWHEHLDSLAIKDLTISESGGKYYYQTEGTRTIHDGATDGYWWYEHILAVCPVNSRVFTSWTAALAYVLGEDEEA